MIVNISIMEDLKYKHFVEMMLLEKQFYSENFITPAKEAYKWYIKYPFTTVAAEFNDKIIGFVNMFPVKEEVFESIKAGHFNDQNLTLDDIESLNSRKINMFLSCIVVSKEFRKMGLTKKLLRSAVMQYIDVSNRCNWIIIDNVTEEGVRFSENYGFSFVCNSAHGSKIYMQPYKKFVDCLFS